VARLDPDLVPELVVYVFATVALALRISVSAGFPASTLRTYCLAICLFAIAVTLAAKRLWLAGHG